MRHDAVCVSVKKRVVCASSSIAGMSEYHVIFDLCFQILKLTICQIIKIFETNQSVPLLLREVLSFFLEKSYKCNWLKDSDISQPLLKSISVLISIEMLKIGVSINFFVNWFA